MPLPARLAIVSAIAPLLLAAAAVAGEQHLRGYKFTVPDGLTVEIAAEAPLVGYPICADFDEQGRLYVSEASGVEEWRGPQEGENRHRVLRLVDEDGDGRFDTSTEFARFEMVPQGSMWLDGSLYVAAPPVIWKLTDVDDDGIADEREPWVEGNEVTGCLNDLHGPYLGPDGWIYWCKGAGATQTYEAGGESWSTEARHIFRRHPRGRDVEQVMVGGMDNPVEVAFSPGGERFFTSTNLHLQGTPRIDGVVHAVYGGRYPKDTAPVYHFPQTSPDFMPLMTQWGASSPAGLMRCESDALGAGFRDSLISALFSYHKVMRHMLEHDGATFRSREEDVLACEQVEFHPTDVLEDADGSLLVVETGGWYRHCCPSSTFYRPDVRGAIYRVRRTGAQPADDPRGLQLAWNKLTTAELAGLLADERHAVRDRAMRQVAKAGGEAAPELAKLMATSSPADARRLAVWTATRIDDDAARALGRAALADPDETVRQAALHSVSLWRDQLAAAALQEMVTDTTLPPHNRRAAAEALGRLRDAAGVPALLSALSEPIDAVLAHSLTYALIEINNPAATRQGLSGASPSVQVAALTALDQMATQSLTAADVVEHLSASDLQLRSTAWWIAGRHPEWAEQLVAPLRGQLTAAGRSPEEQAAFEEQLARFAHTTALSKWLADEVADGQTSPDARRAILRVMSQVVGQMAPAAWRPALASVLSDDDTALVAEAVATIEHLPPFPKDEALQEQLATALLQVAHDKRHAAHTRLHALAAIPAAGRRLDKPALELLLTNLEPDLPLEIRSVAADVLAGSRLSDAQRLRLAEALPQAAASELPRLLEAFQGAKSQSVGQTLIAALERSEAATAISPDKLSQVLAAFGVEVQSAAAPLLEQLAEAHRERLAAIDRLAGMVAKADPHRGLQVFQSNKAGCIACHKSAHVGGEIGPSLRGVGRIRTERDLLESILFPSASFVQSFEPWTIVTDDGRQVSGVVQVDRPEAMTLSAGPDKTFRVPREQIVAMVRSEVSIMPTGLEKILSDQELADLVAYLRSLK